MRKGCLPVGSSRFTPDKQRDLKMNTQTILSTALAILTAWSCMMVCGALTLNDSGKLQWDMSQRGDSNPLHSVNITQEKTGQLLQLIKKMKARRHINDTKVRVLRSIPKRTILNDDIDFLHIRKRRATPPRSEQWNIPPMFNATKHIKRHRKGQLTICERVICDVGTYVKHCVTNFTADACTPCPRGTYIYDVNKSEQTELECRPIHHCHHWPGTVRTHEMIACAGDYWMECRCDTDSGHCGLDPCNCMKKKCQHDEILLQDCTCEQTITTTVKVQVTTSEVPDSTYTPAPPRPPVSTTESPPQGKIDRAVSTTSTTVREIPPTTRPTVTGKFTCSDVVNWDTVGATIGIFLLILVVIGVIVLVIYCYRQDILNYLPSYVTDRLQFSQVSTEG